MSKTESEANTQSFPTKEDSGVRTHLKKDDCNIQYGGVTDDNVALIRTDSMNESRCSKFYGIFTSLTIEPALFSFIFAFVMNMSVMTNMMMDKGCRYHLNYSVEVCRNLSNYKTEKDEVEILATNFSLYANLTHFISAFLMTFISSWSDKYGRRLPLLVAIVGSILTDIGYILCTVFFESRLEYLVISRLPGEFTGGFICMLTIVFSHASEVSSEKNRTLKYTSVEIALGLGFATGGLTGGFLYRYYGYLYVYVTVAFLHLFSFLWVFFVLEETTGLDVNMKWHEKTRDFFSWKSFKSSVTTTCRPREGNTRALILLLLTSMCIIILNYEAFGSIAFVYVHHVYDWDPSIFSIINTSQFLAGIVITFTMVPVFLRVFKFRDFTLGIIGSISMMGKNTLFAFSAHHKYIYYAGMCAGIFSSCASLSIRTAISKLVEKEELGRVFSFLATCEAVAPLLGTIAFSKIMNVTLDVFPNVPYTLGSVLILVPLGGFIWAWIVTKTPNNTPYVPVIENNREKI